MKFFSLLSKQKSHFHSSRFLKFPLLSGKLYKPSTPTTTTKQEQSLFQIQLTDSAIQKIQKVNAKFNTNDFLRIRVDSGGCHGFQYAFDLTSTLEEDDIIFESNGKPVAVIDSISWPYLSNAEIDYEEALIGSQFKVSENPNAASECGCKVSFQLKS